MNETMKKLALDFLKKNLKDLWPDIMNAVETIAVSVTDDKEDRWVRIGCAALKAGGEQFFKEFKI